MSFDDRYDDAVEEMTNACYKLSVVYGEEQVKLFSEWLHRKGIDVSEYVDEFIRENRE